MPSEVSRRSRQRSIDARRERLRRRRGAAPRKGSDDVELATLLSDKQKEAISKVIGKGKGKAAALWNKITEAPDKPHQYAWEKRATEMKRKGEKIGVDTEDVKRAADATARAGKRLARKAKGAVKSADPADMSTAEMRRELERLGDKYDPDLKRRGKPGSSQAHRFNRNQVAGRRIDALEKALEGTTRKRQTALEEDTPVQEATRAGRDAPSMSPEPEDDILSDLPPAPTEETEEQKKRKANISADTTSPVSINGEVSRIPPPKQREVQRTSPGVSVGAEGSDIGVVEARPDRTGTGRGDPRTADPRITPEVTPEYAQRVRETPSLASQMRSDPRAIQPDLGPPPGTPEERAAAAAAARASGQGQYRPLGTEHPDKSPEERAELLAQTAGATATLAGGGPLATAALRGGGRFGRHVAPNVAARLQAAGKQLRGRFSRHRTGTGKVWNTPIPAAGNPKSLHERIWG